MRRLIVQMQMSVDGFVASDPSDLDWTVWDWGPDCAWDIVLQRDLNAVYDSVSTILLSRVMIEEGFLDHWTATADKYPDDVLFAFARRIVEVEKVVASSKLADAPWPRSRIVRGPLAEEIAVLKSESGDDIICFGGVRFAAALLAQGLVDELQLFVNPTAVHGGRSIFDDVLRLRLTASKAYECGIVVNKYAMAPSRSQTAVGTGVDSVVRAVRLG